ncbi:hypothetical protein A9R05_45335 (plasmid) [Burkholderia sp. KK1]|nr:hypothetical protein A9R05_45335 [Burkholderia sp. KK1]
MRLLRFNISALLVRAPTKLFSSEKAVEGPRKRAFGFLDRVDHELDVRPQAVEGYPAKCQSGRTRVGLLSGADFGGSVARLGDSTDLLPLPGYRRTVVRAIREPGSVSSAEGHPLLCQLGVDADKPTDYHGKWRAHERVDLRGGVTAP